MRWSFARFGGEEFKRALPAAAPQQGIPTQSGIPSELSISHYVAAAAHEMPAVEEMDRAVDAEDLANQVSELKDLFPRRTAAPNRLRQV
jgi:hypothetical protein